MTPEQLYETLRKLQEPKGFYFNDDKEMALALMNSLLENKQTYGYMSCPCRLASGEYEKDKDIICPCVYREPDVRDYGACFCWLYVSKAWNDGKIEKQYVPERRPPEKVL